MAHRRGRPTGLTPDGPKIRRLRVGLGLTATELAGQIGRHPESVRQAERGRLVSDVFASRLARALGVRMSDITNWTDDEDDSDTETEALAS